MKKYQYVVMVTDDFGVRVGGVPEYAFGNTAHDALMSLGFGITHSFGHGLVRGLAYAHVPAGVHGFGFTVVVAHDPSSIQ